ncbi:MAG: GNAT family N-acetyltransferase [Pseudomonadota bacterium]
MTRADDPGINTALEGEAKVLLPGGVLRLRSTSRQDSTAIATALADKKVARYLAALPFPLDDEALNTYLDFLCGPGQVSKTLEWNGDFAGVISLASQLTFWIARKYWRQGLAGCAVKWLTETHFAQSDDMPLRAQVHIANIASIQLLNKLGFEQVGPVKRRFSFVSETAEEFVMLELSYTSWSKRQTGEG